MSEQLRCRCARCTIRGLLGPAVVITIGVLFLLQQTRGGYFSFENTYPVILVVIGALLLASSLAPMAGHIYPASTSTGVPAPPNPPADTSHSLPPGQGQ